jgi:branched-chain amino acid transport system ATP-binding protein
MSTASSATDGAAQRTPAGDVLLSIRDLHVSYDQVPALFGIDLEVREGEFLVLLGPNGAGKTTTLRTVSGLLRPARGEIHVRGQRANRWNAARLTREGIAHVPEGRQIFPDHSVLENLQLGGYVLRRKRDLFNQQLEEVFGLFPRLKDRSAQSAGTLSGGEAQMLAVARALMTRPTLLMLDEPSLGLAPQLVAEMFGYIERLNREQGLTILLVEQAALLALTFAHRGYVLETGRVVTAGTAAALKADPKIQEVFLGGTGGEGA